MWHLTTFVVFHEAFPPPLSILAEKYWWKRINSQFETIQLTLTEAGAGGWAATTWCVDLCGFVCGSQIRDDGPLWQNLLTSQNTLQWSQGHRHWWLHYSIVKYCVKSCHRSVISSGWRVETESLILWRNPNLSLFQPNFKKDFFYSFFFKNKKSQKELKRVFFFWTAISHCLHNHDQHNGFDETKPTQLVPPEYTKFPASHFVLLQPNLIKKTEWTPMIDANKAKCCYKRNKISVIISHFYYTEREYSQQTTCKLYLSHNLSQPFPPFNFFFY